MPLDVVETLQSLVRIPSVNPMGREVSGEEFLEYRVTDHLERLFAELELPYERQQVEPQRSNIMARLDGPAGNDGPVIVFEAHQDTVPVDGMIIEPWSGEVRDGRMWGRGSCDIKGGMACMLSAISRLAEERPADMPTIIMACSVNEEHGFTGASAMSARWAAGDSSLVPRKPDAVVVAEPTSLNVVVAHKGVCRWQCNTSGRAAHSSQPHLGDNAIYHMARVLNALERYAKEIAPQQGEHRLLGSPTLSVGIIEGGISVNTVPDRCSIQIDRRVLPGEDPVAARQHIIDFVAEQVGDTPVEHDDPFIISGGLDDGPNTALAGRVSELSRQHGGPGELTGVPFGTDAPAFDGIGIPTVVFGPGSIDQAHTNDEWIEIDQLHKATEILYHVGKQGVA